MMHEAVLRRYTRILQEKKVMPDLILIDGGKGQLSAAFSALKKLDLTKQPIIALAKRLDEVFKPGFSDAQNIRRDSAGLKLLQRVRDESHRFAITAHRKRRTKASLESILDSIPGIGTHRREKLLKQFGSVINIKAASLEDIKKVDGISINIANEIWDFFHPSKKS